MTELPSSPDYSPELFELMVDKIELRESERKPI